MFRKVRTASLAVVLAIGVWAGIGGINPEGASAHTFVNRVSCGSSVSPSQGTIQIGYHYGSEPFHRYYWRVMTAGEYWSYCF
jgi:hypothetical protein